MPGTSSIAVRIKEGDIAAFEEVFRAHYYKLCLFAATITGCSDAAEDIVQELFYKWWRDREKMNIRGSVKNYLYGAVRNNSLTYLDQRKPLVNAANHNNVALSAGDNAQRIMESAEFSLLVEGAIASLPERRRKIFIMHREEGVKYKDIAESMGLSVKTVEAEMTKAYATLRNKIENYK